MGRCAFRSHGCRSYLYLSLYRSTYCTSDMRQLLKETVQNMDKLFINAFLKVMQWGLNKNDQSLILSSFTLKSLQTCMTFLKNVGDQKVSVPIDFYYIVSDHTIDVNENQNCYQDSSKHILLISTEERKSAWNNMRVRMTDDRFSFNHSKKS